MSPVNNDIIDDTEHKVAKVLWSTFDRVVDDKVRGKVSIRTGSLIRHQIQRPLNELIEIYATSRRT